MNVPFWVILISLLVALPAYVLWGVGVYMVGKALYSWVFVVNDPQPPAKKAK